MNKNFLTAIIILLLLHNDANCQVIVSEGFENAFPPTGWTLQTGNNSNPWQIDPVGPAYSGSRCMKQDSYNLNGAQAYMFTAFYPLTSGINYRLSYWYKLQSGDIKALEVTLGRNYSIQFADRIFLGGSSSITNANYQQAIYNFTVPVSGSYNVDFNSFYSPNYGRLLIDNIVLEQMSGISCNGTPPPGIVTAPTTICPDSSFVLSVSGIPGSGVGYQWQSSTVGSNNFTDIPGATTVDYTTTQKVSKDYQCISTCWFSGLTSVSNAVTVTSPVLCYCNPSISSCTQNFISNITFAGINNTSACSITGYTNYTSLNPAAIAGGGSIPFWVTVNTGTTQYVSVYIDYNHNGLFDSPELTLIGSGNGTTITKNILVPITPVPGPTLMRVMLRTGNYQTTPCTSFATGETEDYTVNISPFVCSGVPAVGLLYGITNVCAGVSFPLYLTGSYTGYDLQWESSLAGVNNFIAINGANTTTLTTTQPVTKDYRVRVTCAASGLSVYSNLLQVITWPLCYCVPAGSCSPTASGITNVILGTLNNSSGCVAGGFSDYSTSISPGNITAGTTVPFSVTVASGASGGVAIWIDFNQNGTFEANEFKSLGQGNGQTLSGSIFVPSNMIGLTRLRVRRYMGNTIFSNYGCTAFSGGETEDYTLNVLPAPVGIYFSPFADTLYSPVINVTSRILQRDVGLNTGDSLAPRIWARRYGTSSWKSFKGSLISGTGNDGNWQFPVNNDTLGIRHNSCDSVQFYFVAQDNNLPSNIGYLPETGALHSNVQIQISAPSTQFGYRLKPRLKDTIYVGSGDCRYRSLSGNGGLFQQINTLKLEGDLTIIIESDLVENTTNELTGNGLNGYRLTIRPSGSQSRAIMQTSTYGSILKLNGVKNVVVDGSFNGVGRFLEFTNASSTPFTTDSLSVIEIKNSCDSITLKNLVFRHAVWLANDMAAPENAVLIRGGGNKNILVTGNLFTNLSAGNMCHRHIASFAGNDNVTIRGNEFNNFTEAAIKMFGAGNNWVIDSNHFYRTVVPTFYSYDFNAINLIGAGHIITNNYVGGQAPFCGGGMMNFIDNPLGSFSCIRVTGLPGTDTVKLYNNHIDKINMGNTYAAVASSFNAINVTDKNTIIKNNVIGNPLSSVATITPQAGGISGIVSGGRSYSEIRDNIVTGITNAGGSGAVTMVGIGSANSTSLGYLHNTSSVIAGNKIFNIHNINNASSTDYSAALTRGITFSGGFSDVVEKNNIYDISCNEYGVVGIEYENGDSSGVTTIQQNRIYNLGNTATYNGNIWGIYLRNVNNNLNLFNNQVSITNNNVSPFVEINGIADFGSAAPFPNSKKQVMYNTVYIGGAISPSTYRNAVYLGYNLPSNAGLKTEIYNNIFYNERINNTTTNYAFRFMSNAPGQTLYNTRMNNNFYVVADTISFMGWGMQTIPVRPDVLMSWTTWKNKNNLDDTSYVIKAGTITSSLFFVDKNNGNLNIRNTDPLCWNVNGKGKPLSDINSDFDSLGVRSTNIAMGKTDIGSDEFSTITNPPGTTLCPDGSTGLTSSITGAAYQWQQSIDSIVFTNLADNINYAGTNTRVLQLNNIPSSWYGYQYRCLVNGGSYDLFTIRFVNTWTGTVNSIWENPGNWSCGAVPDMNTDVVITSGTVVLGSNAIIRSLTLMPGVNFTVGAGFNLTITH